MRALGFRFKRAGLGEFTINYCAFVFDSLGVILGIVLHCKLCSLL